MVEHAFTVSTSFGTDGGPSPTPAPVVPPQVAVSDDRIVHPFCDPSSNQFSPSSDRESGCSGKLAQCARDGSTHKWEYDAAEQMLDQCFASCASRVGGVDNFCSLTQTPPDGSPKNPFCRAEGQHQWSAGLNAKENEFVVLLNQQRAQGYTCPGNNVFGPQPAVRRNPQLDCAARAQARKIVAYSDDVGFSSNSPSLHNVCSPNRGNCDSFSQRIEDAGYTEWWGYIGENANWGYTTAASTLEGWSQSSGHCPLLMKQDWAHIQVEIGIGYYQDSQSGSASWVMVAAQR
ncbi:MAG: hypothetical protein SGARI_004758 [Bacillariaceae sp.]